MTKNNTLDVVLTHVEYIRENIDKLDKGKANKWVEKVTIGAMIGLTVYFFQLMI